MYERSPKDQLHIQRFLSANCFGDYYTRSAIGLRLRELITLSILIALGGVESEIKGHIQGNLNIGHGRDATSNSCDRKTNRCCFDFQGGYRSTRSENRRLISRFLNRSWSGISVRPETPITPIQLLSSSIISPQTQQLELDILQAVNQYWLGKQLQALAFDQPCATQAQSHSVDMASGRVPLGHDGFLSRFALIASSPPGGHPQGAAEQVAAGQQTAQDVVQGWVQEKLPGTNQSPIEGVYTWRGWVLPSPLPD